MNFICLSLLFACVSAASLRTRLIRRQAPPSPTANSEAVPWFKTFQNLGIDLSKATGVAPFSNPVNAAVLKESALPFVAPSNPVSLQGIDDGSLARIAPIPVPGFPGKQDTPLIPGVNTIPGLDAFNYLVGSLIPQAIPPANQLIGGSLSRLLPQDQSVDVAKNVFNTLAAPATNVEVDRMMGRWFQVINSPHLIREACTVAHYGALTNNSYSATFTILKFYREGNSHGSPRFSLGYGFKAGDNGTFLIHNSNSPDSEPYWVVKTGPLNGFNQYDYAIISNWVRFPVVVLARDPERFQREHMRDVLEYLERRGYINVLTKALNMIAPVDYTQCQYTPTFSGTG